ncbi:carbohydrate ABC transporter permease [Treponema sp. HNW]|uniref:carbohydrate ABC transporter permease n=1 Tax=Treponema sp. HNW TaxID=3116654 RepID=UPI003D132EF2
MARTIRNNLFLYIINAFLGLLYISPLLWMVVSSLKPESRIFADMTRGIKAFLPLDCTFENYHEVFVRSNLLRYIGNSIFYVTILVFLSMLINSMCGYALAKFNFRGKNLIFTLIIALFVLPLESIILSLYWIVNRIGWNDSYRALIIPFIAKCFDIYLFRQFFLDIPDDLIEAAAIDGAGQIKIFFQLIIPISGPVFATVLILDCVAYWSDFMWPLLVTLSPEKRTVQLGLQAFFTDPPIYYGPIMAALVVSVIPMILMFTFFQKYYVQGITATGIKG